MRRLFTDFCLLASTSVASKVAQIVFKNYIVAGICILCSAILIVMIVWQVVDKVLDIVWEIMEKRKGGKT